MFVDVNTNDLANFGASMNRALDDMRLRIAKELQNGIVDGLVQVVAGQFNSIPESPGSVRTGTEVNISKNEITAQAKIPITTVKSINMPPANVFPIVRGAGGVTFIHEDPKNADKEIEAGLKNTIEGKADDIVETINGLIK